MSARHGRRKRNEEERGKVDNMETESEREKETARDWNSEARMKGQGSLHPPASSRPRAAGACEWGQGGQCGQLVLVIITGPQ